MIVTGITSQLRSDAERRCAGRFLAWLREMQKDQWASWAELLQHYPRACRTSGNEAHFPLTPDGIGVRAAVTFQPSVLRLLRMAPAPVTRRQTPLSRPNFQPNEHAAKTTL
jgi:hypothetical protein